MVRIKPEWMLQCIYGEIYAPYARGSGFRASVQENIKNQRCCEMSHACSPTDAVDIAGVVSGRKAAWDRFVEIFSGLLLGAALRTLRARSPHMAVEDARDVVQDVFLRLVKDDFRLLRGFDPARASLPTWLTVVARSTALDALRRQERHRDALELDDTIPAVTAVRDMAFGGRLDLPPGLLSERQRQILRMLFDDDLDVAEIAGILKVQAQTVRSLKHQALSRLREHYAPPRSA